MPAILHILGMEDSFNRAIDPRAWIGLMEQAGVHYLLAMVELAGLALLAGAMQFELIPRDPAWLHGPLTRMAWLVALFVGYHEVGRVLRRSLGTAAPRAAAAAVPGARQELTEEEALAMRAAERLGADQRFARGAKELQWLATRPGSSPQLHARFRELLALAGDEASLLVHARSYVAELLSLGEDRDALALYLDSFAVDPHFELAEPGAVTRLLEVSVLERQLDLAISLAREFLRRFPDEPDAVPNGLSAARILDRQGRDEDARQLLASLIRRFPQHPLRGEMMAALETLEGVARRGS
jgi:tetratricopeptide (TPR) repeat protein